MQAQRPAMYALVAGMDRLDEKNRRKVTRFLDSFFETLDDPKRFEREIAGACRG
jgi:hypothetical protein